MKIILWPLLQRSLVTAILAASVTVGACLDAHDGRVAGTAEVPQEPPTSTLPETSFALTYISGHLGHYDNCHAEALPAAGLSSADSDGFDGAGNCAEPGCGWGCEHGELTLRLTNDGEAVLDGTKLSKIALLLAPGDLELTTEALSLEVTDGVGLTEQLEPGDHIDFRVAFRGLLAWRNYAEALKKAGADSDGCCANSAKIRAVFEAGGDLEEVVSPALHSVTDIDT